MDLVTSNAELAAVCERLARHPFVTVDTEFLRETTFWPKLCVVQMAGPDEAVIVDALAPELDLAPFFRLMVDERVVKVFHAARQDVEIAWNLAKLIPKPMFDTQVAAMVLGYGDSISYDQLVQRITGDAIDKTSRFTDWSRRPLSPAKVTYAISDVTHLRDVYFKLKEDLEKKNRLEWVEDEMKILTSPETYKQEPHNAWQRLKTRVRKPKELAVLMEVAAWREREAQSRDLPRARVLKDDAIAEIAHQRSEEHTSELQSHHDLVCRLLLEKKKKPFSLPTAAICRIAPRRHHQRHMIVAFRIGFFFKEHDDNEKLHSFPTHRSSD